MSSSFMASTYSRIALTATVAFVAGAVFLRRMGSASQASGSQSSTASSPTSAQQAAASPAALSAAVFIGSQTGTAEDFAKTLVKRAQRRLARAGKDWPTAKVSWELIDLEDFEYSQIACGKYDIAVFCVATYGEGDPTDNALEALSELQAESTADDEALDTSLASLRYAVFGLGNRQYVHYCKMADVFDGEMEKRGARALCEVGRGDDDDSIEDDFEQWLDAAFLPGLRAVAQGRAPAGTAASAAAVGEAGGADLPDDCLSLTSEAERAAEGDDEIPSAAAALAALPLALRRGKTLAELPPRSHDVLHGGCDVLSRWIFHAHSVPLKTVAATGAVARQLRQKPDAAVGDSTVHLELDVSGSPLKQAWQTADNLELCPVNPEPLVRFFASALGTTPQEWLQFAPNTGPGASGAAPGRLRMPFPSPTQVRTALGQYSDLQHVPPASALKQLAGFLPPAQRARIGHLCATRSLWRKYIGPKSDFRLAFQEWWLIFVGDPASGTAPAIPLSAFLQLVPRQHSRAYTIASSSNVDCGRTIGLSVVVDSSRTASRAELVAALAEDFGGDLAHEAHARLPPGSGLRMLWGIASTMLCGYADGAVPTGGKQPKAKALVPRLLCAVRASKFRLPRNQRAPLIMISAGTGIAPFRGMLADLVGKKDSGPNGPQRGRRVLLFGCRRRDEDFLYREELEAAVDASGSDRAALTDLWLAFSREDATRKVYVQDVLGDRVEDLRDMLKAGATIMVCGSLRMGHAVQQVVKGVEPNVEALYKSGRYIEELWA